MPEKRGKKLRRGPKHATMYAAQFYRTARNKAAAKARIARRKRDNPSPLSVQRDTTETGSTTS